MNVQISLRVDGREVAVLSESLTARDGLELEQQVETLKSRTGCVLMECGSRTGRPPPPSLLLRPADGQPGTTGRHAHLPERRIPL
jgi:hypothetical protein